MMKTTAEWSLAPRRLPVPTLPHPETAPERIAGKVGTVVGYALVGALVIWFLASLCPLALMTVLVLWAFRKS